MAEVGKDGDEHLSFADFVRIMTHDLVTAQSGTDPREIGEGQAVYA